jgi:hypothetical protein
MFKMDANETAPPKRQKILSLRDSSDARIAPLCTVWLTRDTNGREERHGIAASEVGNVHKLGHFCTRSRDFTLTTNRQIGAVSRQSTDGPVA